MPFRSEAQRRYLFMAHPKIAREFADATPKNADLPEKVGQQSAESTKKNRLAAMRKMAGD